MIRRVHVLMVSLALVTAVVAGASVWAQGSDGPPTEEEYPEKTVRDLFDDQGQLVDDDKRMAKAARDHSGGFGGFYFEADQPDTVFVYMKDVTQVKSASASFNDVYFGDREITNVSIVQGTYAFNDLLDWFALVDTALVAEGIYPNSGAVMERHNRIWFGMESQDDINSAKTVVQELGEVPNGAVMFEIEEQNVLRANKDHVQSKWRPVVGGIQRQNELYGGKCTIGFVTKRGSEKGVVLASHCTNEEIDPEEAIGGVDGANIHQPNRPYVFSNKIADETLDPALSNMSHHQCTGNLQCRYSDAAFAKLKSNVQMDQGHIAKPEELGDLDVDPAGATFEIIEEDPTFSQGDTVYWVGKTSGWQEATIAETCTYIQFTGTQVRIVCVGKAEPAAGSVSLADGDSGAPVFAIDNNDEVRLLGTAFSSTTSQFKFSKIGLLYYELDSGSNWWTCTSGC